MSKPEAVIIPLLNPNEPEALISALHVGEGQHVTEGEPLCTLETTKSAAELEAERDGFVVGLRFGQGESAPAGETLCYIAAEADWEPPQPEVPAGQAQTALPEGGEIPPGLRITQPARTLARQGGLDLGQLPLDRLITEDLVKATLAQGGIQPELAAPQSKFDPMAVIIYGGGGHAKALIELLRTLGTYRIVGLVDDGIPPGELVLGLPLLGGGEALPELYEQGVRLAVNAVGGIGNLNIRARVFQKLAEAGFACPAVVHPTAFVEASATLAEGVQVFPHAYVGSEARLGIGCIVNTGAIVSHDCNLGDFTNVSPGAMLAGEVQVGASVLIGMGATLNLRVAVGAGARIGNGATVKQDVPEKGIVRAGAIWPD